MKKFVKKLSFVMAAAMVVTSLYAPTNAEAASKNFVRVKGSKKAVTSKAVYVGGRKVNFDYTVGKKTKGVKGAWTSSNTSVATVNKKTGVVTAVGNGTAVVTFKTKKTKKMKKVYTMKVKVIGRTRAESVTVDVPTDASVKVGKTAEFTATLNLSEKIKAAGGKESTYMVFAESDTTAASVKVDGKKVVVEGVAPTATPATIKVYAAQTTTLEKAKASKYQAKMAEFKVAVKANLEAKQAGANKIKVTGDNLSTNPAMYVVKNDKGTVLNLKNDMFKLNDAKTEAILVSTSNQIIPGKYVLTYDKNEVMFDVEKAKVTSIKFKPEDILVRDKADHKKATVSYMVYDQFGDDVTMTSIPQLNFIGSASTINGVKGLITVTTTAAQFNINVDKVSITVVDKVTGVTATQLFTVGQEAMIAEVAFKGLYSADAKKIVPSLSEADDAKKFFVLFTTKDQYGREMTNDAAAKASLSVSLPSATNIKTHDAPTVHEVKVDGVSYLAYQLDVIASTQLREGKVTVTAISLTNGKMANGTFEVTHKVKVDAFTFGEGPKGIFNKEKSELTYTATDLDGKPVTDLNALKEVAAKINGLTGTEKFEFDKDDKTGKISLYFTPDRADIPGNDTGVTPIFLSVTTPTFKLATANLSVMNTRKPVEFLGVKKDVATGTVQLATREVSVKFGDLRFQDQYGNEMDASKIEELHTGVYKFKMSTTDLDDAKTANVVFTYTPAMPNVNEVEKALAKNDVELVKATVKKVDGTATADIKLQLMKAADKVGDVKTITLSSVTLADMEKFEIKDVPLQPANDVYLQADGSPDLNKHKFAPTVFGLYKGQKIELQKTEFTVVDALDTDFVKIPNKKSIPVTETTAKTKFKVIILNGKATEVEKEYTYSKAAPTVAKVERNSTALSVVDDTAFNWATNLKTGFKITDQYGEVIDVAPYITFAETEKSKGKLDIDNKNGTAAAGLKIKEDGTFKVKVKFVFPGHSYIYEDEVELTRT